MSTTERSAPSREARKLRTLLHALMDEAAETAVPAICARIRKVRKATIDPDTGGELSIEAAAARVKPRRVSAKTWGEWERWREPSASRLRQIAVALGLDEDYFQPSENLAQVTAQVEAEAERLHSLGDGLAEVLEALRSQIADTKREQPPDEQKQEPPEPG